MRLRVDGTLLELKFGVQAGLRLLGCVCVFVWAALTLDKTLMISCLAIAL